MLFTPAVPPLGTRYRLNVVVEALLLQKYIVVTASPTAVVLTYILAADVISAELVIAMVDPYNTNEYTIALVSVVNSLWGASVDVTYKPLPPEPAVLAYIIV